MVGRCSRVSREKMDACWSFRRPSRAPTTRAKLAEIGGTKKCPILGHIKSEQAPMPTPLHDHILEWRCQHDDERKVENVGNATAHVGLPTLKSECACTCTFL